MRLILPSLAFLVVGGLFAFSLAPTAAHPEGWIVGLVMGALAAGAAANALSPKP